MLAGGYCHQADIQYQRLLNYEQYIYKISVILDETLAHVTLRITNLGRRRIRCREPPAHPDGYRRRFGLSSFEFLRLYLLRSTCGLHLQPMERFIVFVR